MSSVIYKDVGVISGCQRGAPPAGGGRVGGFSFWIHCAAPFGLKTAPR